MLQLLLSSPSAFVLYTLALLIAITIHEFSHAFVADYLGDPTPRIQGRISLNPLVHLDTVGTLFLVLVGFGWGKPVMFDPFNLKNPRKDSALIALAGPVSNIILAVTLGIILRIMILLNYTALVSILSLFITPIIYLNIILAVFNLLPIYPLDGFNFVAGIIPEDKYREWIELKRYGFVFLIMLIIPFGKYSLLDIIMRPIINITISWLIPSFASL